MQSPKINGERTKLGNFLLTYLTFYYILLAELGPALPVKKKIKTKYFEKKKIRRLRQAIYLRGGEENLSSVFFLFSNPCEKTILIFLTLLFPL